MSGRLLPLLLLLSACDACRDPDEGGPEAGPTPEPAPTPSGPEAAAALDPSQDPRVIAVDFRYQPEAGKATNGVLMVRFAEGRAPSGWFRVPGDDGEPCVLSDGGTGGDAQPEDGTWSGPCFVDVKGFLVRSNQLGKAAAAMPAESRRLPFFRNRQKVAEVPMEVAFASPKAMADTKSRGRVVNLDELRQTERLVVTFPEVVPEDQLVGTLIPLFPFPGIPVLDLGSLFGGGEVVVPSGAPATTDPGRTIMIVDPLVVRDPTLTNDPCTDVVESTGPWTFRAVMEGLANTSSTGITGAQMAERFIRAWGTAATVNGEAVPAPGGLGVPAGTPLLNHPAILEWQAAGWDLDQAPFRLYAISYRPDLASIAGGSAYGGSSVDEPGEGRLLFQFVDNSGASCNARETAVIFEYRLPKESCADIQSYAQAWQALDLLTPGSGGSYNTTLRDLTKQFIDANASPARPNGSAIAQVRVNDAFFFSPGLSPLTWDLRELTLQPASPGGAFPAGNYLLPHTIGVTPKRASFPSGPAGWLATGTLPTGDVAGWVAYSATDFWGTNADVAALVTGGMDPTVARELRLTRSKDTCNGCHGADTFRPGLAGPLVPFYHVKPPAGAATTATLSEFLTGAYPTGTELPQSCAAAPAICFTPTFADLERRGQVLDTLASMSCSAGLLAMERIRVE